MNKISILFIFILLGCTQTPQEKQTAGVKSINQANDPEAKLKEMGIILPEPSKPVANYLNSVRTGNLVFMAGKGPRNEDGTLITGKLGENMTVADGYAAARRVAIAHRKV